MAKGKHSKKNLTPASTSADRHAHEGGTPPAAGETARRDQTFGETPQAGRDTPERRASTAAGAGRGHARDLSHIPSTVPDLKSIPSTDEPSAYADQAPVDPYSDNIYFTPQDELSNSDEADFDALLRNERADRDYVDHLAADVARELGYSDAEATTILSPHAAREADGRDDADSLDATAEQPVCSDDTVALPSVADRRTEDDGGFDSGEAAAVAAPRYEPDGTQVIETPVAAQAQQPPLSSTALAADAEDAAPRKNHRRLRIALVTIVCVLGGIYLAGVVFFWGHFLPYTKVSDVDASFKSAGQTELLVRDHVNDYSLVVVSRANADATSVSSTTIQGSAVDLHYADNGTLDGMVGGQNPFSWPVRLVSGLVTNSYDEYHVNLSYDASKLDAAVNKLPCMQADSMTAPADACPYYDGTNFVVKKEVMGTTLDAGRTEDAIAQAMSDADDSIDLDEAGCYTNPTVYSTDPGLIKKVDFYNQYARFSITYDLGDAGTEVLDGNTAISWYDFDDAGNATLNENRIAEWVAAFASKYDTVGTDRTFTSVTGASLTVSGGTYGWQIDQDAEVEAIKQDLASHTTETREPNWASKAVSHASPEWGNTYIEVSISAQHWWYVANGVVQLDTDCVTGSPDGTHDTPTGVYDILDKQSPYTMHGTQHEDGSYDYVTTCQYWLRVTWTGVGFHDAPWQPYFGGSRYTVGGSHGCINTPTSAAASLYSICSVGTPVIIHS